MMTLLTKSKYIICMFLISTCGAALGDDSYFNVTLGAEYASGSYYSNDDVEEIYVPFTLSYGSGSVGYRITVPYLSVRAPVGTIITNSQGQAVVGEGPITTENGLGDIVAGITFYDLYVNKSLDVVVDATAKVKVGTADEIKGLGTGENDYSLQTNLYKFFDSYYLNASVGYKFRGDPSGLNLNDVWFGSLGASYRFSPSTRAGIAYDYRESSFEAGDTVQEVSAFVSHKLDNSWGIQFYTFTGFNESSPDWGLGTLVKYSL
ncbi:MAG TPA: hypothetical protein DE042_01765 [Colwellia sp.]|nr:hypothetical protein [Colwellia sp.]